MTEKANKADVDYSAGMAKSHCGKMFDRDVGYCKHFIALSREGLGECQLVKGSIRRSFWCRKFERAVTK